MNKLQNQPNDIEKLDTMELDIRKKLIEALNKHHMGDLIDFKEKAYRVQEESIDTIDYVRFSYDGPQISIHLKSKGSIQEFSFAEITIQVSFPISKHSELEIVDNN